MGVAESRMNSLGHSILPKCQITSNSCPRSPHVDPKASENSFKPRLVGAGELGVCLELLAEQAALVLDAVSWPARRDTREEAADRDDAVDAAQALPEAARRFAFGVTLDQIDALECLVRAISAQGDVIATTPAAELADGTLPQLGQAIFDAAAAVQELLEQVETQRLGEGADPDTHVREAHAVYAAGHVAVVIEHPRGRTRRARSALTPARLAAAPPGRPAATRASPAWSAPRSRAPLPPA